MINKFQAMSMIRKPEFCEKTKEDGYDCFFISVDGHNVGVVCKFHIGNGDPVSYSCNGKCGTCKNIMQGFAQVVESFMNAYNEKWKKENRYEVAKEQFKKDIMRNGSFISGDIIYLNDGDYGIIDSVLNDGYELFMNSSNKYHSVMSDGRGVTVFGTLDKNHSLSVDWKKTFITYLDGFQPSGKTGD